MAVARADQGRGHERSPRRDRAVLQRAAHDHRDVVQVQGDGGSTDFCLAAAERLFDYEPSKILLGSAEVGDYDVDVARAFLERLTPQNSLIVVTGPELEDEEIEKSDVSARDSQWQTEEVRARVFCVWSRVRCYCLEISNPFLRLETEIRREVSSNPHLGRTRQGGTTPPRSTPAFAYPA